MKNIAYAGALCAALDIDMQVVAELLEGKIRQEEGAARIEPQGPEAGLRLRPGKLHLPSAVPSSKDGGERRQDPDRRQYGHRARLPLRGRDRGGVVSHHAGHIGDGRVQSAVRTVSPRSRYRQEQFHHPAGRRRTRRHRHGARRHLERRARVHLHRRPRHLADERIAGSGVLRRDSRRHHRRAARRALHRHAHAHAAGRYAAMRLRLPRRYAPHPAVPVESGRVLRVRRQILRSGGALSDPGADAFRSRHRHERLGDPAPEVGRFLPPRPRPRAHRRGSGSRSASSSAIGPSTKIRWPPARFPASIPRDRILSAAPATTSSAAIPKFPTNIRK